LVIVGVGFNIGLWRHRHRQRPCGAQARQIVRRRGRKIEQISRLGGIFLNQWERAFGAHANSWKAARNETETKAEQRTGFFMACTSMHSLHDFSRWMNRHRSVPFAVVFRVARARGVAVARRLVGDPALFPRRRETPGGFIDNRGKSGVNLARFEAALPYSEGSRCGQARRAVGLTSIANGLEKSFPFATGRFPKFFATASPSLIRVLPNQPVGASSIQQGSWVHAASCSLAFGPPTAPMASSGTEGTRRGLRLLRSFREDLVLGPYFLAFPFAQGRARVQDGVRTGSE